MEIVKILKDLVDNRASDVFIVAGRPLSYKRSNMLLDYSKSKLTPDMCKDLIGQIYALTDSRDFNKLLESGDDDFSFSIRNVSRFRVNMYKQRGSLSAVIRIISFELPDPAELNIPEAVLKQADYNNGLVLITGSSGSGKSTTLACMIDRINTARSAHIVTLEDPIEFLHLHKKSIISQREISLDTSSYITALRASLRQSPDVILLGELRDTETITTAMTASETGHLVISSMHTVGAANTIDRIIDVFPAEKQSQVRMQLAMVLQAVVSQQLVAADDGKLIPVFEIMTCTNAIRNMIREAKTHQIDSAILASSADGMISMDSYLLELYKNKSITEAAAVSCSVSPEFMRRNIDKLKNG